MTPSVAIIGAGFGGIAAAVKLRRAGIDSFTIFEKSDNPGGTWWENQYPGAEVDTASHIYSYSFKPFDWSRTHAGQRELLGYLEQTVDEYGLASHLRLGTAVTSATWDEQEHRYHLLTSAGALDFDVVISALGLLNVPRFPEWPGLESFAGPKFHTARWDADVDLTGKRVAVVGTGSSGCQVVPAIAGVASKVLQFQREPGWIRPKGDRDFSVEERTAFTPRRQKLRRAQLFWALEQPQIGGRMARPGTKAHTRFEEMCRDHITTTLRDRPDLQKLVTPEHPFYGKRPLAASNYYQALLRDDVELIPLAVERVTPSGVVDVDGNEHEVDVLVMATGFQPANFLATLDVVGRDGRSIHEAWAGEPRAFLGITVPGFPNFFMLYGPNTNGGIIVFNLERQAEFAVRSIERMRRRRATSVEVRPAAAALYDRWLTRRMRHTAWVQANNYYKSASGRIVTNWPDGALLYWLMTKSLCAPSSFVRRAASALSRSS